jgi:esterase/lipase
MKQEIQIPCVGYSIVADWYEGSNDEVLLVLPGFTSSKKKYEVMIEYITKKLNSSALVIEYSGHGKSPFNLMELTGSQNFSEVVRAFDWIRDNHPAKNITVFGTSYGGLHATLLTKYRDYENVILRVPAAYDERKIYTPIGKLDNIYNAEYRSNAKNFARPKSNWMFSHVDSVSGKKLVIIHENDEKCPEVSTRAFAEAFDANVWVMPGLKHGFKDSNMTNEDEIAYYQKIVDWMQK